MSASSIEEFESPERGERFVAGGSEFHVRMLRPSEYPLLMPLLRTLNPTFSDGLIVARLEDMKTQGYRCAAVFRGNEVVGCCGIWIFTKVYCGRFIEPDNVCVTPDVRSLGIGAKMIEWVMRYGEAKGCDVAELNAYSHNAAGHKFWFNRGFKILGFHFQRELRPR